MDLPTDAIDEGERPDNLDDEGGLKEDLTLPPLKSERLEAGDETYDLRKAEEAEQAQQDLRELRQQLRNGELDEYEGKSTEYGHGGRSRLLHDEVRAKLAVDYHDRKHTLSWDQQRAEADRIVQIRAAQWNASRR